jgi:hypothetical protein
LLASSARAVSSSFFVASNAALSGGVRSASVPLPISASTTGSVLPACCLAIAGLRRGR